MKQFWDCSQNKFTQYKTQKKIKILLNMNVTYVFWISIMNNWFIILTQKTCHHELLIEWFFLIAKTLYGHLWITSPKKSNSHKLIIKPLNVFYYFSYFNVDLFKLINRSNVQITTINFVNNTKFLIFFSFFIVSLLACSHGLWRGINILGSLNTPFECK